MNTERLHSVIFFNLIQTLQFIFLIYFSCFSDQRLIWPRSLRTKVWRSFWGTYCNCGTIPDLSVTGVIGVMGVMGVMGQKGEAPIPNPEEDMPCGGWAAEESCRLQSTETPLSWEMSRAAVWGSAAAAAGDETTQRHLFTVLTNNIQGLLHFQYGRTHNSFCVLLYLFRLDQIQNKTLSYPPAHGAVLSGSNGTFCPFNTSRKSDFWCSLTQIVWLFIGPEILHSTLQALQQSWSSFWRTERQTFMNTFQVFRKSQKLLRSVPQINACRPPTCRPGLKVWSMSSQSVCWNDSQWPPHQI